MRERASKFCVSFLRFDATTVTVMGAHSISSLEVMCWAALPTDRKSRQSHHHHHHHRHQQRLERAVGLDAYGQHTHPSTSSTKTHSKTAAGHRRQNYYDMGFFSTTRTKGENTSNYVTTTTTTTTTTTVNAASESPSGDKSMVQIIRSRFVSFPVLPGAAERGSCVMIAPFG